MPTILQIGTKRIIGKVHLGRAVLVPRIGIARDIGCSTGRDTAAHTQDGLSTIAAPL